MSWQSTVLSCREWSTWAIRCCITRGWAMRRRRSPRSPPQRCILSYGCSVARILLDSARGVDIVTQHWAQLSGMEGVGHAVLHHHAGGPCVNGDPPAPPPQRCIFYGTTPLLLYIVIVVHRVNRTSFPGRLCA